MIITRDALVEEHACSDGLEFFDTHFPGGEGTQEAVFEAIEKYAPTKDWQAWLASNLGLTTTCRRWYSDGKPHVDETYVEGKHHGLRRTWWSDGTLRVDETYVEGKRHGLRRTWHSDGTPREATWDHGVRISSL